MRRLRRETAARAPGARGVVLLYHRVGAEVRSPEIEVSAACLDAQLALLAARFTPLALGDLVAGAARGRLPRGAVAVTFDDAYVDVLDAALPALERHRIPTTVFVVTEHARDGAGFWWDRVSAQERDGAPLGRALRHAPAADRRALLAQLGPEHGSRPRSVTRPELLALAASPLVEIGSHTRSHPSLPVEPDAVLAGELQGSRADLAEWLGQAPAAFAHPFGDVSRRSLVAVRRAGFAYAVGTHGGAVTRASDRFDLPRITAREEPAEALERRLSRALQLGPRRR